MAISSDYRKYLPDLSLPRFQSMQSHNAHTYVAEFKERKQPPWLHGLYEHWLNLLQEPFRGVTIDGHVKPDLYSIEDEEVPIDLIVEHAMKVIDVVAPSHRGSLVYHIDDPQWRTWSNPEFLLSNKGIRLDEQDLEVRDAAMNLLKVVLSPEGYIKAVSAMRINGFLGELVNSPKICNELSYNLCFFGQPTNQYPWGLSFYGHHLCLNVFFYKTQMAIAPFFTGAEPNIIDEGPYKGTRILHEEEKLGLQLMQSLDSSAQSKAQIFREMKDPAMPKGRWNHDDQRHLCGAYRDNRVVPYEGLVVSDMNSSQQEVLMAIVEQYLLYLPERSRLRQLNRVRQYLAETYFCWIGGFESESPFYFRIQSPVILVEFDHHSGVFLNNIEPAKFHIHTMLRLPNGGDYGHALRTQSALRVQDYVWEN